jgi:sugar phosphate isomerase/epimerase
MALKYAFMTFSTPKLSLTEALATAKQYGYAGIEPRTDAGHGHGVEVAASAEQRKGIKKTAADSGVAIACLATSCQFANPATQKQVVEQAHERIDLAGDVGCSGIRVFGGDFPYSLSRQQAIALMADGLSQLAEHAQRRGVKVCLETHDLWCDPRNVAAVLAKVNHPNILANWDIMHTFRYHFATMPEAFEALWPRIGHVHVHDGTFTDDGTKHIFVPMGTGVLDHKTALRLLASAGYQGFISGEWISWEPAEVHLPRELAAMTAYEK